MTPTKLDAAAALERMDGMAPALDCAPAFDYSGLDKPTVDDLHFAEKEYQHGRQMAERGLMHMSDAIAVAHEALCGVVANCDNSKHGNRGEDTFKVWCASIGITKDTAYRLLQVANLMDHSNPRQQKVLKELAPSLLYAVAKPSAPAELVKKVKDGEITTHKAYRDLLKENQQLREDRVNAMNRAERAESRAYDAETRLKNSCIAEQNAQEALQAAESARDAAIADMDGLMEQNTKLKKRVDAAEAREEEAWKMHDKAEARAKAAEDAMKHQPLASVVDEEEVDRRAHQQAYGIAADMTDELRTKNNQLGQENAALQKQLEEARGSSSYDSEADMDTVCSCIRSIMDLWAMAFPAFERLTGNAYRNASDYADEAVNNILRDIARVESERAQKCSKEVKA